MLLTAPVAAKAPETTNTLINPAYGPKQLYGPTYPIQTTRGINQENPARPIKQREQTNSNDGVFSGRTYSGKSYSKEEVIQLIIAYSEQYQISPDTPLHIAKCESGYRWDAANPTSSARGVFQYLSGTWKNTPEGKSGLSAFDGAANVRAAVRHIAVHGTSPWNASKHCWNK